MRPGGAKGIVEDVQTQGPVQTQVYNGSRRTRQGKHDELLKDFRFPTHILQRYKFL